MGVSSESQGQQIGQNEVNRAEIVAAKVFYKSISPWETSLSRPFLSDSANAVSCLSKKILCIILPNRRTGTSESLSYVLTRQSISIYIRERSREPQKVGESFRMSERNIFQDPPGYCHMD